MLLEIGRDNFLPVCAQSSRRERPNQRAATQAVTTTELHMGHHRRAEQVTEPTLDLRGRGGSFQCMSEGVPEIYRRN